MVTGQLLLCKFAALLDNGVHEVLYDWVLAVFVGLFAVEVVSAFGWVGRRQRLRFGAVLLPHFKFEAVFVAFALLFNRHGKFAKLRIFLTIHTFPFCVFINSYILHIFRLNSHKFVKR